MTDKLKNASFLVEPTFCDWATLLRDIPVGIFITDWEGELCYNNDFLHQVLKDNSLNGYLRTNIFDNKIIKSLGLDFEFKKILETKKRFSKEKISYKAPDGSSLYLSLKATPLKDEKGKIVGIICFVEDQTEKVNLDLHLKRKISQLSIINEVSNALATTLKTERIFKIILTGVTAGEGLGFNRAFFLLKDENKNELYGKMAVGPSNPEEASEIWKNLSQKKQSLKEILSLYPEVDEKKDIEVNRVVKTLRVPLSEKDNVLVEAIDKRKSFNLSEESEKKLSSSLANALGTRTLAIVPLVCEDKVFGVILADNFITEQKIKDEDVKFLQVLANQASRAIENSRLYERVALQVKKLEEANKNLEENTKKMLKFEKFSIMGQITSKVAHQIRNPLTIIGGFAKSILKKTDEKDPNYKYLKIISEETQRVEKMLDQILNYSPNLLINLRKQNLNRVVESSLKKIKDQIDSNMIIVEKDFQKDLPELELDSEQFEHALLNILRNALSAMPEGGRLWVRTFSEDDLVKIEIADNGVGIPPDGLPNIFDPFFTTKAKANGLGLTVAQEIIKRHNGRIMVKSQKERGSVFSIQLSLRRERKDA